MPRLGFTRPRWLIIISRTHAGAVLCLANSHDYQPAVAKLCYLNCGAGFDPSVAEDEFSTTYELAHAATSFWLPSDYGSMLVSNARCPGSHLLLLYMHSRTCRRAFLVAHLILGAADILALGLFYTSPGLHDNFIDSSSFPS